MDNVALGWLVYELTGDAFMVGVTAGLRMIPLFLLGIVSGAVADRVDRRVLLRIVTLTGAINMFVLGSLLVSGIYPIKDLSSVFILDSAKKTFP